MYLLTQHNELTQFTTVLSLSSIQSHHSPPNMLKWSKHTHKLTYAHTKYAMQKKLHGTQSSVNSTCRRNQDIQDTLMNTGKLNSLPLVSKDVNGI